MYILLIIYKSIITQNNLVEIISKINYDDVLCVVLNLSINLITSTNSTIIF